MFATNTCWPGILDLRTLRYLELHSFLNGLSQSGARSSQTGSLAARKSLASTGYWWFSIGMALNKLFMHIYAVKPPTKASLEFWPPPFFPKVHKVQKSLDHTGSTFLMSRGSCRSWTLSTHTDTPLSLYFLTAVQLWKRMNIVNITEKPYTWPKQEYGISGPPCHHELII